MATLWKLAVLYSSHIEGKDTAYFIRYFAIGGTASTQKVTNIEDGATKLMNKGFEPFGASSEHGYKYINIWFRREIEKKVIKRGKITKKPI